MKIIKVNDMTCMSCANKIRTALLIKDINAKIDVLKKEVLVEDKYLDEAIEIIKKTGYNPVV